MSNKTENKTQTKKTDKLPRLLKQQLLAQVTYFIQTEGNKCFNNMYKALRKHLS